MNRIIVLFLFFSLFFFSCQSKKEEYVIKRERIVESVYASGIVKSKGQYTLYPKISGILNQIFVEEGATIKDNQILFSIENENSKISKQNALLLKEFNSFENQKDKLEDLALQIELSKNKYKTDSINFARQKILWIKKAISELELEQSELNLKSSKTQLLSLKNKYTDLKKQIQFSEKQSATSFLLSETTDNEFIIKSDINGKIYGIFKEKGELISPQTPLAIIGSENEYYVELQIDEKDISRIELNQKTYLKMDSYPNQVFEAKISKIIPYLNEKNKTFTVEAVFLSTPKKLYPNLSLEASIVVNQKENAMVIPINYLIDNQYVNLQNEKKIKVKTGLKNFEKIEIINGLKENDRLILLE